MHMHMLTMLLLCAHAVSSVVGKGRQQKAVQVAMMHQMYGTRWVCMRFTEL